MSETVEPKLAGDLNLPCFMKQLPHMVDGWAPPTPATGDHALDFATGQLYADMAVMHAREVGNPTAISFILACICVKAGRGDIQYAGLEEGFTDRIARLACAGSLN